MLKHEDINNKVDYKNIIISDLGKIVEKSEDDSQSESLKIKALIYKCLNNLNIVNNFSENFS